MAIFNQTNVSESEYSRRLTKRLTDCGAVVFSIVGGQMQGVGWPDRHVDHRVWSGWLEAKLANAVLRPMQKHRCECIERAGGNIIVIRYYWLDRMIQLASPSCDCKVNVYGNDCQGWGNAFLEACFNFCNRRRAFHTMGSNEPCDFQHCHIRSGRPPTIYYGGSFDPSTQS